jgi:hypothetical protein
MSEDGVQCEPLSRLQIPVNREKYREFFDWVGVPNQFWPVFTGLPNDFWSKSAIQNREFLMG